ncbi:hypothetical protein KsCSTR_26360 [Candidatus Kuenenia stuttgartiensis]|uniref:Uncharacterized protein n=1 Tax=Kuenenia stuttgartiensis TaxID=174633 RepID=Q1Q792_KUEST|nr:hypothetical protein KsCSTR_26360 [Candidatus Kuenenia stuttgartiensis]CAJ73440.1 unknown protein [Candidatus Kuenenia stuttgartiensis]
MPLHRLHTICYAVPELIVAAYGFHRDAVQCPVAFLYRRGKRGIVVDIHRTEVINKLPDIPYQRIPEYLLFSGEALNRPVHHLGERCPECSHSGIPFTRKTILCALSIICALLIKGGVIVMRYIRCSATYTSLTSRVFSKTTSLPGNNDAVWPFSPRPRKMRSKRGVSFPL